MTTYYLIRNERVMNSNGADTYYEVQTVPGRTNMSHEERTEGWLGQTNDWSRYAEGEYDTLEDAVEAIPEGYQEDESYEDPSGEGVAKYVSEMEVQEVGNYLGSWTPTDEDRAMPLDELASMLLKDAEDHHIILDESSLRSYLERVLEE